MTKKYTEIEGIKYELCLDPPTDDPNFPSYEQPICKHLKADIKLVDTLYYGNVKGLLRKWELEPESNFKQRQEITLFTNFFKKAVKIFPGFLSELRGTEKLYRGLVEHLSNVDGCGNDLSSFLWQADLEAIKSGFCGLLLDCAGKELDDEGNERKYSLADVKNTLAPRPYLVLITHSNIMSWSESFELGESRYERVTIRQFVSEKIGLFGTQKVPQYKTFYDDGSWINQVILMSDDEPYVMTIDQGESSIQALPIVMYSSTDLNATHSEPPLEGLAKKNKAHYELYSEYRNLIYRLNSPAIVREGLITPGQTDFSKVPPVVLGGSVALDVPIGGDVRYVEPSGTCLATDRLELDKLEESMTKDTLEFIFGGGAKTATEINMSSVSANATLSGMAILKQSAIEQISELWASYYQDYGMGGSCAVNQDLLNVPLSSQDMSVLAGMVMNDSLSNISFLELMSEGKRLPKSVTPSQEVRRIASQVKLKRKLNEGMVLSDLDKKVTVKDAKIENKKVTK